jgi:hypothetical protein
MIKRRKFCLFTNESNETVLGCSVDVSTKINPNTLLVPNASTTVADGGEASELSLN